MYLSSSRTTPISIPPLLPTEAGVTASTSGGQSGLSLASLDLTDASLSRPHPPPPPGGAVPPLSSSAKAVDQSYFDSYGGFGIHQDMIADKV